MFQCCEQHRDIPVHLHCNGVMCDVKTFAKNLPCNITFGKIWRDGCKSRYFHFFCCCCFLFFSPQWTSAVVPTSCSLCRRMWVKRTYLDEIPPLGTTCNITITSSVRYPGNMITLDTCFCCCGNTPPKMKYWIFNEAKIDPITST